MASVSTIKIVIIGSGNLAWHLASFFKSKKLSPEVYNHRASTGLSKIKQKLGLKTASNLNRINKGADYYFICVSDRYISSVSKKIKTSKRDAIVLHCSGSMSIKEINKTHDHRAVIYPLQSFSQEAQVVWKEIPLFLQSSDDTAMKQLNNLLKLFPGKKVLCDDASRLRMHLAAVLVNNFTNALYSEAHALIGASGSSELFNLLLPLIKNGLGKLEVMEPAQAQTGPAKREDKVVMKKHLQLLKKDKDLGKLYRLMSARIAKQQNKIYA